VSKTRETKHAPGQLIDKTESWQVVSHEVLAKAHIVALSQDVVYSPSGEAMVREMISHPGAVAIMALDEQGRIAVVHQYRHAVRMRLVEPPAGLLDVAGESALAAAQRELAEEAGLAADDWRVLVDFATSPGISDEVLRVYLARGLRSVPRPAGFEAHGEEVDMGLEWLPLSDAVDGVRAGLYHNVTFCMGSQALALALAEGAIDKLRPGDAPWPMRQRVLDAKQARSGGMVRDAAASGV